jgi:hypothetical protein
MVPRAGSLMRNVTRLTKVCIKKEQLRLILKFIESKIKRHMQNEKFVVLENMDPCYSLGGLS